jgi:hypothetical protein
MAIRMETGLLIILVGVAWVGANLLLVAILAARSRDRRPPTLESLQRAVEPRRLARQPDIDLRRSA